MSETGATGLGRTPNLVCLRKFGPDAAKERLPCHGRNSGTEGRKKGLGGCFDQEGRERWSAKNFPTVGWMDDVG